MNLNKLQYFLSVAECLNFTEAARRHYISQTAMSQQILALEQELGVTLFHRSHRQVTLTPAGTALVAEAQKLLAQYDSLLETLFPFREEEQRVLRIDYTGPVEKERLRQLMVEFERLHPETQVRLKYTSQNEAGAELLQGKCDMAASVYEELEDAAVYSVPLLENPIEVAVSRRSPLARKERLTTADLAGENLVLLNRGAALRGHDVVKSIVQGLGLSEANIRETDSIEDQIFQVELNHGVSLLPRTRELESENLVFIHLEGFDFTHKIGLFYREETPVIRAFLRLLH